MNYLKADWQAPAQIKAYTTLRSGWGERFHNENRELQALLPLPEEPVWLTQTHSSQVIEALEENRKKPADASFTTQKNRVCAVLTADCLPILVCNKKASHVAAIHAGWRGLAGGIIETALQALQQPAEELLIWLGPAIGPQKFEVGTDVFDAFVKRHPESASAFIPYKQDKWLANLYDLARIRLKLLGVSSISGGHYCTYTQEDLFFSYRRDQGKTGRMASLIWISND
jgi:YfiH family protein